MKFTDSKYASMECRVWTIGGDLPFRVAALGAQVAGEFARGKIEIPWKHAQRYPAGSGGHGVDPDHRGIDRHSPAPDAWPTAHRPRFGVRFLLASERTETAEEV